MYVMIFCFLSLFFLLSSSVVTGCTDGIGKAYAEQASSAKLKSQNECYRTMYSKSQTQIA